MFHLMKRQSWKFTIGTLLIAINLQGQSEIEPVDEALIHEAYIAPITASVILETVPTQPPPPIKEKIPPQSDRKTIWISGYWTWSEELEDFVWMTGVWRSPPPGRQWVSDFWEKIEEGWTRVHGFWSSVPQDQIHYIDIDPPEPVEENAPPPPNTNFFWVPGYWNFITNENRYTWVPGEWEEYDPNWVLVPAHYLWRPEGYILVTPYWDYPLDQRGRAYAPIEVLDSERHHFAYKPTEILDPEIIIEELAVYYPNYSYLCAYDYHYHPDHWAELAPPWWGWPNWWTLPWHDQWGVWWWYTHPDYPHPRWLHAELRARITPPPPRLKQLIKKAKPPYIVTKHGVVSPKAFSRELGKNKAGKKNSALPANRTAKQQIQDRVKEISPPEGRRPLNRHLLEKPSQLDSASKERPEQLPIVKPEKQVPKKPVKDRRIPQPIKEIERPRRTTPIFKTPKLPFWKDRKQSPDSVREASSGHAPKIPSERHPSSAPAKAKEARPGHAPKIPNEIKKEQPPRPTPDKIPREQRQQHQNQPKHPPKETY